MSSPDVGKKESAIDSIANEVNSIIPRLVNLNSGFDSILIKLRGEVPHDGLGEQADDRANGFVGNMEYFQKQISTCISDLQTQLSELQSLI